VPPGEPSEVYIRSGVLRVNHQLQSLLELRQANSRPPQPAGSGARGGPGSVLDQSAEAWLKVRS
jgi:hypothetical protein